MKKLSALICLLFLLMTAGTLTAQVVDVCAGDGTDSVTLFVSNYQYGNIQWQYSEDTLTWIDILGANDTVYRFMPENNQIRYYRAWMQYPNCPSDSSQITRIQFMPTAKAGFDRVLSERYEATLEGNLVNDARCMWAVIEGDSAVLEDPTYPCSSFSGTDSLYRLTWTVANACGVSIDTVEIRYLHTVMYDAIVIVDSTDIILSDSAELASGIYRIVFSAPVPSITDSTVLMGITDGGFLRKVIYFEFYGDTCEMVTTQAGLVDILLEGAINLEIPLSTESVSNRGGRGSSYTRASIMNDPRYLSGQWGELLTDIILGGYSSSVTRNRGFFGHVSAGPIDLSGGAGTVQLVNPSIYFSDGSLKDVIKYDFWEDPTDHSYHAFVSLISDLHIDYTLRATDDQATVALNVDIPTPAGFTKGQFSVGLTVPISLSATFSGVTEIPVRITKPIRLGAFYKGNFNPFTLDEDLTLKDNSEKAIVEKESIYISDFELQLSVGAKLGFRLWKLPGFEWSIMPTLSYSKCTNTTTGFQREKVRFFVKRVSDFKFELYTGVKAGAGFDDPTIIDEETWYSPYKIFTSTNRNLVHTSANSYIQDPIYVHVYNQDNRPVKSGRKVLFESTSGVVSSTPLGDGSASAVALTNSSGIAQIYWKPLSSNATLKASVLDCESNHIKGSPLYFYTDCVNSTLSLGIDNGRLVASGGYPPLMFSSNGISWLPEFNRPYPLTPGTTYFVKDDHGCEAATTYSVQEAIPPCELTASTYQNGLQVRFVANNGTAPYHFYVDGVDQTTSGTTQRVFQHIFTQEGEHSLAVSDANGCTMNKVVSVSDGTTVPTVATSTTYNRVHNVYDQVVGAVTDNGGSAITERGIQWDLSSDMSNATNVISNFTGNGLGRYVCNVSGVSAGTTYYARAYATNSKGTGYGTVITLTVPGSTPGSGSANSCGVSSIRSNETGSNGTITAVRDHQNNSYAVVQIGSQCWLKENMRCTTSPSTGANMVENPAVEANMSATVPRAYYYDDNTANAANGYGLLYNWPAAMDGSTVAGARGICPEGWHLPTDAEWTTLMNTAVSIYQPGVTPTTQNLDVDNAWLDGGNTAISSMLSGGTDWDSDNSGEATPGNYGHALRNATGFYAVPAGAYASGFYSRGQTVDYWSSSAYDSGKAWAREWKTSVAGVGRGYAGKESSVTVRCLRNSEGGDTPTPPSPTSTSCGVSSIRSNETGSNGTITAVQDHENNSYSVVQIGSQCWLKENMRCTTSPTTGANMVENPAVNLYAVPRAYYYDNDPANAADGYGLLYNWSAAMDGSTVEGTRGICPEGWHLPTDAEWTTLMNTAVSIYQPGVTPTTQNLDVDNDAWLYGGNTAISSMLSGGTDWDSDNSGEATPGNYGHALRNTTGFSAVPAGFYGGFSFRGQTVFFWSSSACDSDNAWHSAWGYNFVGVEHYCGVKVYAHTVRCLRNSEGGDTPTPPSPTSTSCSVSSIHSNETGSNGTITAVQDHENNSYSVVQIGSQCWLKENMRCTTSPGTGVNMVQNPANDTTSTIRRAYYYDNNPNNADNGYGLLYNWPAAMDGSTVEGARGICPEGWHVPTDAEWTTMMNTAVSIHQPDSIPTPAFGSGYGGISDGMDNILEGVNTSIGPMISVNDLEAWSGLVNMVTSSYQAGNSTTETYNTWMSRFNDPLGNVTGFSALPAGGYDQGGFSSTRGFGCFFYSSTENGSEAWARLSVYAMVGRMSAYKPLGCSVRCLRNSEGGDTPTPPSPTSTSCSVSSIHSNEMGSNGTITAVQDHENNSYSVVQIGSQCWLKENMRCTTSPTCNNYDLQYYYYDNNPSNAENGYGLLYDRSNAMNGSFIEGSRGICPEGWHLPTDTEWVVLMNNSLNIYLQGVVPSPEFGSNNNIWGENTSIAHMLSDCSENSWTTLRNAIESAYTNGNITNSEYNEYLNRFFNNVLGNITGFSAYPAGMYYNSNFVNRGSAVFLLSSSSNHILQWSIATSGVSCQGINDLAVAVRCLRNSESDGTPTAPSLDNISSCSVSSIHSNETGSGGTITAVRDHENNGYAVVQIGDQCWLRENLRTTSYADGTIIPLNSSANTNDCSYRSAPNNDMNNVPVYGYLYDWCAAVHWTDSSSNNMGYVQGICPSGWHVPSATEWELLAKYLSERNQYVCGNTIEYVAKSLASTDGWNTDLSNCAVGNILSANNATGFSARPAGSFFGNNDYVDFGDRAYFWTADLSGWFAYHIDIHSCDALLHGGYDNKSLLRYSVRCLRD